MTKIEFDKLINKIENFWQNTNFNREKREYWFEFLKILDVKILNMTIDGLVRTSKFLPSISEILEKYQGVNIKINSINDKKNETNRLQIKDKCLFCDNDGGFVLSIKWSKQLTEKVGYLSDFDYEFYIRCSCLISKYVHTKGQQDKDYICSCRYGSCSNIQGFHYVTNINDVMDKEEIEIYKNYRKHEILKYKSNYNIS